MPQRYAQLHGLREQDAHTELTDRFASAAGNLEWYCLDHWSEQTGLEIKQLKWAHRYLIAYLPGVIEFLRLARQRGKSLRIVTNAHPETVAIKIRQTRLDKYVDGIISSHELDAAKESPSFWDRLRAHDPFDADRCVLFEDNLDVLGTARESGILNTLAILCPDSCHPPRDLGDERSVDGLIDIIDTLN